MNLSLESRIEIYTDISAVSHDLCRWLEWLEGYVTGIGVVSGYLMASVLAEGRGFSNLPREPLVLSH